MGTLDNPSKHSRLAAARQRPVASPLASWKRKGSMARWKTCLIKVDCGWESAAIPSRKLYAARRCRRLPAITSAGQERDGAMLAGCGRGRTVLWARPADPDRRRRQRAVGSAQRDERPRALFQRRRWYQLTGRPKSGRIRTSVKQGRNFNVLGVYFVYFD